MSLVKTTADDEFIHAFRHMSFRVYTTAKDHGFWDRPRNDGEMIALIHSELSEALEGIRHDNPKDKHCPLYTSAEVELADAIIRIMDMAHGRGYRIAEAIVDKNAFNQSRPHKHGKTF